MKAISLYGINDLRCEDLPVPVPGPGEILLRVASCGLCGTDIAKIRYGGAPVPSVLGHEIAGVVASVGAGVKNFAEGDRVAAAHHLPCFKCDFCLRGSHSQCEKFKETNIYPGGFAEYVLLNSRAAEGSVFNIPDKVSMDEACFMETAACCIRAFDRAGLKDGECVLVIGAGPVGLLHVQIASILGAGNVIAADIIDSRLSTAEEFGAGKVINVKNPDPEKSILEATKGKGAGIVIVTAGSRSAYMSALRFAAKGARVVFFGGCPPETVLDIDFDMIYKGEMTLLGSYSSTPLEQFRALEMLKSGRLRVEKLITHRFKLHELPEAVEVASDPKKGLKVIIDCGGGLV